LQKAIEDYTQAIQLVPDYDIAYCSRGLAYSYIENYDLAIEDFNYLIKINPNEADVYKIRGFAYLCKEEYDLAIADFNIALELDPDNLEYKQNLETCELLKKSVE
jgi:tetratricopeptide (TPR) repeat protein